MSGTEPEPAGRDQLMQEAAAWFARMRGPDAASSEEAFKSWLGTSAAHRQAYNRASEIFAMGKLLVDEPLPAKPDAAPERERASRHRFLWAALGALLLAAAMFGWLALGRGYLAERTADPSGGEQVAAAVQRMSTTPGETRSLRLADGSLVTLAGGTVLEVRFSTGERRLDLSQGRARFDVFHEPRPFIVHAGGGSVTARGTVFEVGFTADRRIAVRLLAGAVDVAFPPQAGPAPGAPAATRLRPGETVSYALAAQGSEAAVPAAAPAAAETSASGARDYDRVPVADLVAAANRDAQPPIRLDDPAIAARRVSGHFRIDDTGLLAERLAELLDLRVDRSDPRAIVLRPR